MVKDKGDNAMGKLIRNGIEYGGGNGTDIFEVTQAEYDALKQAGTLVHNALYVISDAPNLNPTASDIEYSSGVTVADRLDISARFYVATVNNLTVTANSALNLGTVSELSGGRIATRYQCRGISVISGAGSNYSFLGAVVIGATDNVAIYPFRSDTNVSIRIGFLY